MTIAIHADTQAHRLLGATRLQLHTVLKGLATTSTACQNQNVPVALRALQQLEGTLDPRRGEDAVQLLCLYQGLSYLVKLGAWDAVTPIVGALLDACLYALADEEWGVGQRQ